MAQARPRRMQDDGSADWWKRGEGFWFVSRVYAWGECGFVRRAEGEGDNVLTVLMSVQM